MRRRRATVAAVATPGEWQCKTARSSEWAQHFSDASCCIIMATYIMNKDEYIIALLRNFKLIRMHLNLFLFFITLDRRS